MADKDKNDNVEYKKKMVEKKANDDFEELIDAAQKKREESEKGSIKKAKYMLIKEYGYSESQIEEVYTVPGTNLKLDLVVLSEKSIHAEQNAPLIVIEIKKDGLLLPHDKNQLLEYVNAAHAKFGMLYDGKNKLCYTKLDDETLVDVVDIPSVKSFQRPSATDGEAHIPVTITLNNILKSFRTNPQYAPYAKYLPHILAMFISSVRTPVVFQETHPEPEDTENIDPEAGEWDDNARAWYQSGMDKIDQSEDDDEYSYIKKRISQTKREFRFLQWKEFEEEFDKLETREIEFYEVKEWNRHLFSEGYTSKDELFSKMKVYGKTKKQIEQLSETEKWKIVSGMGWNYTPETILSPKQHPLFECLNQMYGFVLTDATLERARHDVLVQYTKDFPAQYKGAEGEYFTPDVLIKFSLQLLQPKKGKKLLIADSLISLLTVKHFLSTRFELENSSLNAYVKKNITAISNREPNSINQFEMMLPEFNLKVGEPIKVMEGLGMFDYVFSCVAFGMPLREQNYKKEFGDFGNNSENYLILNMLKHVNPEGTLALVLPSGFLFRSTEKKIRNKIAKECYVRAIIQLPPGTFNRYSGISVCLLILEKKGKKHPDLPDSLYSSNYKIFMSLVPGKSKISYQDLTALNSNAVAEVRLNFLQFQSFRNVKPDSEQDSLGFSVSYDDLGDIWDVARFTPESRYHEKMQYPKKLGDVVESIFTSSIATDLRNKIVHSSDIDENGKEVNILRISDLEDGFIKSAISVKGKIPKREVDLIQQEFLEDNDIIISNKGTIGKTAIYKADGRLILPSPQLFVIKANTKKVYPEYLFKVLNSKFVQDKLISLATGAYISSLSKKDLENIVIPVPPKKQQHSEDYLKLIKQISNMQNEIRKMKKKLKEFDI